MVLILSLVLASCSGYAEKNARESASAGTVPVGYTNQYIDLHLHLDGAITQEIAKKLAEMQNIWSGSFISPQSRRRSC